MTHMPYKPPPSVLWLRAITPLVHAIDLRAMRRTVSECGCVFESIQWKAPATVGKLLLNQRSLHEMSLHHAKACMDSTACECCQVLRTRYGEGHTIHGHFHTHTMEFITEPLLRREASSPS